MLWLWWRYPEIPAYLPGQGVRDLRVPGHGRALADGAVDVDSVPATLPQEFASMGLQVVEERSTLHTLRGSRTTSRSSNSVRVSSLLASRMSETASLRLSRASSRVCSWTLAPGSSST